MKINECKIRELKIAIERNYIYSTLTYFICFIIMYLGHAELKINKHLYQNDLPLHHDSDLIKKYSPDALTPPSGSYSPSLSSGTGITAH
jgi:hypothetical protein